MAMESINEERDGRFLAGVAALIWHPTDEKYLLLQRAADKDFAAGSWECVTGRVNQGESFAQALVREVAEEIGGQAQFEFFVASTHFYRGTAVAENELLGLICFCTLADPAAIRLSWEHSQYRWLTAVEIATFLPAGHWLQTAVARAEWLRQQLPPQLRAFLRLNGLELAGPMQWPPSDV